MPLCCETELLKKQSGDQSRVIFLAMVTQSFHTLFGVVRSIHSVCGKYDGASKLASDAAVAHQPWPWYICSMKY